MVGPAAASCPDGFTQGQQYEWPPCAGCTYVDHHYIVDWDPNNPHQANRWFLAQKPDGTLMDYHIDSGCRRDALQIPGFTNWPVGRVPPPQDVPTADNGAWILYTRPDGSTYNWNWWWALYRDNGPRQPGWEYLAAYTPTCCGDFWVDTIPSTVTDGLYVFAGNGGQSRYLWDPSHGIRVQFGGKPLQAVIRQGVAQQVQAAGGNAGFVADQMVREAYTLFMDVVWRLHTSINESLEEGMGVRAYPYDLLTNVNSDFLTRTDGLMYLASDYPSVRTSTAFQRMIAIEKAALRYAATTRDATLIQRPIYLDLPLPAEPPVPIELTAPPAPPPPPPPPAPVQISDPPTAPPPGGLPPQAPPSPQVSSTLTQWVINVDAVTADNDLWEMIPQSLRDNQPGVAAQVKSALEKFQRQRQLACCNGLSFHRQNDLAASHAHVILRDIKPHGIYFATASHGISQLTVGALGTGVSYARVAGGVFLYDLNGGPVVETATGWEINAGQLANQIINMGVILEMPSTSMEIHLDILAH